MRFFRKKDLIINRKAHDYNDPFLQPLAVAIVSAILVALILIMGFLEIKRSETNLINFMEDQALSTIGVLRPSKILARSDAAEETLAATDVLTVLAVVLMAVDID